MVLWCNLSAAGLNKATANHTDCHCMHVCSFQKLLPNCWGEGVTEPNSFQELLNCERGKWLYCATCNGKVLLLILLHDSGFMTSQWLKRGWPAYFGYLVIFVHTNPTSNITTHSRWQDYFKGLLYMTALDLAWCT